jgi:hypothetical protein
MGNFLRGLLFGIGLSFLLAPMPGQELRRLLSERFQHLLNSLPENAQLKQSTQQVIGQVAQTASNLKNETLEAVFQGKGAASHLSNTTQPISSKEEQTEKGVTATVNRTATSEQQAAREDTSARQASSTEKREIDDPLNIMQDMAPDTRAKLEAEGIHSTPQLLEHTQTKGERTELAHKVGMSNRAFKEFLYRADLMQLNGLGEDVATLLEEAGVNGCKDLQHRNPEHLHAKLMEVQKSSNIVPDTPSLEQIVEWIALAKQLSQAASKEQGVA